MSKLEPTNLENSKSKDSGSKDSGSKNSGDKKSGNNLAKLDATKIEVISSSLEYPEGPIHCHDGSIILVEIKGQRLSKIAPCGTATLLHSCRVGPTVQQSALTGASIFAMTAALNGCRFPGSTKIR